MNLNILQALHTLLGQHIAAQPPQVPYRPAAPTILQHAPLPSLNAQTGAAIGVRPNTSVFAYGHGPSYYDPTGAINPQAPPSNYLAVPYNMHTLPQQLPHLPTIGVK